jgi:hypothetical protein
MIAGVCDSAAVIYTIVETCKMTGANPEAYLADIIDRIADHPASKIACRIFTLSDSALKWPIAVLCPFRSQNCAHPHGKPDALLGSRLQWLGLVDQMKTAALGPLYKDHFTRTRAFTG